MESTLFSDDLERITVTNRRLVVQDKTYHLRQVTSVEFREELSETAQVEGFAWSRPLQVILLVLAALLFCVNWFIALILFVVNLVVAAAFPYRLKKGNTGVYHVMIETASGSKSVISSKDKKLVRDIVEALNNALMMGQG